MKALDTDTLELVAARFRALSEPIRLRLLAGLEQGERSVGELARRLATAQPTVSKHLRILQEAGLVSRRQAGAAAYYSASEPFVYAMCDLVCAGVRRRLEEKTQALGGGQALALAGNADLEPRGPEVARRADPRPEEILRAAFGSPPA